MIGKRLVDDVPFAYAFSVTFRQSGDPFFQQIHDFAGIGGKPAGNEVVAEKPVSFRGDIVLFAPVDHQIRGRSARHCRAVRRIPQPALFRLCRIPEQGNDRFIENALEILFIRRVLFRFGEVFELENIASETEIMVELPDLDFPVFQRVAVGVFEKQRSPAHPVPFNIQFHAFPGSGFRMVEKTHQCFDLVLCGEFHRVISFFES